MFYHLTYLLKSTMMKHLCQAVVHIKRSYILPSLCQSFPRYHKLTCSWTVFPSISINPSSCLTVPFSPAVTSSPASQMSLNTLGVLIRTCHLMNSSLFFTLGANLQPNLIPDFAGLKTKAWVSVAVWKWIFGVIPSLVARSFSRLKHAACPPS